MAPGHNHIGTEHLLLGLASENDGIAARILRDLGIDARRIEDEVIRVLGGAPPTRPSAGDDPPDDASRWLVALTNLWAIWG